jgi:hypothetical protein
LKRPNGAQAFAMAMRRFRATSATRSDGVHLVCTLLMVACLCRPNSSDEGELDLISTHPMMALVAFSLTDLIFCSYSTLTLPPHVAFCLNALSAANSSVPFEIDSHTQDDNDGVLCVHSATRLRWPDVQERQAGGKTDARVSYRVRCCVLLRSCRCLSRGD